MTRRRSDADRDNEHGVGGFADRRHRAGVRDSDNENDDPRPLRDALAEVTADLGLPEPDAFGALVANWQDLVGDELATHCRLQSVRDGILRVSVDSAPRATQLRYLESDVVARASALVGAGVVRAVQVRVEA